MKLLSIFSSPFTIFSISLAGLVIVFALYHKWKGKRMNRKYFNKPPLTDEDVKFVDENEFQEEKSRQISQELLIRTGVDVSQPPPKKETEYIVGHDPYAKDKDKDRVPHSERPPIPPIDRRVEDTLKIGEIIDKNLPTKEEFDALSEDEKTMMREYYKTMDADQLPYYLK